MTAAASAVASNPSLAKLTDVLTQPGGEHIGDIVFWTLSDAAVPRQRLLDLWAQAGLDPDLLPPAPTPEKALHAAVRENHAGHADQLIRLAEDSKATLAFGVVRERKVGGTLNYDVEALLSLDRAAKNLTLRVDIEDGRKLGMEVAQAYQTFLTTHAAKDTRQTIVRTVGSLAAISLRPSGGVYWVPRTASAKVRALKGVVDQIGGSEFMLLPVHDTAEGKATLGQMAAGSIEVELSALQEEIDGFTAEDSTARKLEGRLEAFQSIRDRAELYKSILALNVDAIETKLSAMTAKVTEMLAQVAD